MRTLVRRLLPRPLFRWLRSLAVSSEREGYLQRIRDFDRRVVRHDYAGVPLEVEIADPQGELWYDHDWTDDALSELTLLRKGRLQPGARVFDLGAHQGVVACLLAHAVGSDGQVVALEPNPHNATLARQNAERNGYSWLEIKEEAVSQESGRLRFNHRLNSTAWDSDQGGIFEYEVPATSVDDLAERCGTPDVLFIDVEGFEHRVLAGASRTMATHPDCFVEVHVGTGLEDAGGSLSQVLEHFPGDRYACFVATEEDRQFVPLEQARGRLKQRFFLVAQALENGQTRGA